jgi:O-antigen/teichoic acid export membrane protein
MAEEKEKPKLNSAAKIAKNSLVQMSAGILNKLLGVALIIYAARQLGTDGFGQYAFVLSLHTIFYIFTDFGLGILTVRDLAQNPKEESRYFTNIVTLRCLLSILAGGGMIGTVVLLGHPPAIVQLTIILAVALFFNCNIDTATSIFNAHQRMEIPSAVSVIANTFRVTASLGVLVAHGGVMALIWVHAIYAVVHMSILFWILLYFIRPVFSLDFQFWKKMLKQAYPLALASLFSIIYFRVDAIMLASMRGQDAVGIYSAAYRLLEFTLIIPTYYSAAIFPVIAASYQNNPKRFLLIYRRSLKYMWIISLPMAMGAVILAPRFISMLFGEPYAASVPVLSVLMWTFVLIAINSINPIYLIVMGKQKIVTILILIGMIINVVFNFIFIPQYGELGAAWVTLGSEFINVLLFIIVLIKPLEMKSRMLRHFIRPMIAVVVMAAGLIFVTHWDLGYLIVLGGLVYAAMLWLLRSFDEVDWELFNRIIRPTKESNVKIT